MESNSDHPAPVQKKYFRLVLVLGLLAILGVAIMPWIGEVGMASEKATTTIGKWLGFLGEFHPLFLHLPIGALVLVLTMEVIGLLSFGKYKPHTTLGLFFSAATGIFAVVLGYCLYLTGEYSGELIEEHKRDGILFTILLIATFLVKYAADIRCATKLTKPVYFLGLIATTISMISAGHHGGEVTHGDPMDKAPWKKEPTVSPAALADPEIYQNIIHPILEDKCITCHGPKKQKSGLRMDSYAALLDGGEETDCLVPGDVEKSAMISYLHLPLEDDLHMPPEGKKQLTKEEIEILEWWVSTGAPEKSKLSEVEVTPAISTALNTIKSPEEIAQEKAAALKAKQKHLADVKQKRKRLASALVEVNEEFPGSLKYISHENTDLRFSAVSYRKNFTDDNLPILEGAASDIAELNLGSSSITDAAAPILGKFTALRVLNLNQTAITDGIMSTIAKLANLEVLNLYGTSVTDAGIKSLHGMSHLNRVYLWNTQVTEAGAKALEQSLAEADSKAQEKLEKEDRDMHPPRVIIGASNES